LVAVSVTVGIVLTKRADNRKFSVVASQIDSEMESLVAEYGEGIKQTEAYKAYLATK
jgi:FKBP-type peptidyl-prolyl cis-trans isomerase (trigger factor)